MRIFYWPLELQSKKAEGFFSRLEVNCLSLDHLHSALFPGMGNTTLRNSIFGGKKMKRKKITFFIFFKNLFNFFLLFKNLFNLFLFFKNLFKLFLFFKNLLNLFLFFLLLGHQRRAKLDPDCVRRDGGQLPLPGRDRWLCRADF